MKTYLTTIDGRRRRVTVPENDEAMLDAIAADLSPQAVAIIATRSIATSMSNARCSGSPTG